MRSNQMFGTIFCTPGLLVDAATAQHPPAFGHAQGPAPWPTAWDQPTAFSTSARIFLNYVSFPFFSLFHIPRMLFGKYDRIFLYQLSPVMMSLAGIIVGKIRRIETTMYVLDLWPENLYSVINVKNRFLRGMLEKVSHWHYRNVDKIVVLSDLMKERLSVSMPTKVPSTPRLAR